MLRTGVIWKSGWWCWVSSRSGWLLELLAELKSGDLVGCYHSGTNERRTRKNRATQPIDYGRLRWAKYSPNTTQRGYQRWHELETLLTSQLLNCCQIFGFWVFHLVEGIQSKYNKRHQFEFELYSFILGCFFSFSAPLQFSYQLENRQKRRIQKIENADLWKHLGQWNVWP